MLYPPPYVFPMIRSPPDALQVPSDLPRLKNPFVMRSVIDTAHLSFNLLSDTTLLVPPALECTVSMLPHGTVVIKNITYQLRLPQVFVSNCTQLYKQRYYISTGQLVVQHESLATLRDKFWGSTIAASFVLPMVVVGSWLLIILMVLSASTISAPGRNDYVYNEYTKRFERSTNGSRDPHRAYGHSEYAFRNKQRARNAVRLTALTFAALISAILSQTTTILKESFHAGFMDTNEFQLRVVDLLMFEVSIKVVVGLLIDLCWLAMVYNVVQFEYRRLLFWTGLGACALVTAFRIATTVIEQSTIVYPRTFFGIAKFTRMEIATLVFSNLFYFGTRVWLVVVTISRRSLAFRRETLPLAVVNVVLVIAPFVFDIFLVANIWFKTWSVYLSPFVKILGLYTVDIWLTHMEYLTRSAETSGVLGRAEPRDPPLTLARGWFSARESLYYEIPDDDDDDSVDYEVMSHVSAPVLEANGSARELLHAQADRFSLESAPVVAGGEAPEEAHSPPSEPVGSSLAPPPRSDPVVEGSVASIPPPFMPHPGFRAGDYWDEKTPPHQPTS